MKILAAFVLICALPTPNLCVLAIQNGKDIFMEDVGVSEADTDRGDPQKMTNINYFLDGYNIYYGNPAPTDGSNMDPGYKHQIFAAKYDEKRTTGDDRWYEPDGTSIRDCSQNCFMEFKSREISGAKTYQKSLRNSVSASGGASFGGFGASFSASASFNSVRQKTSSQKKIIIQSTATCCSYKAMLHPYNPPELTTNFQRAIQSLPNHFDDRKYFGFIDIFGTHFIKVAQFGAIYGQQSEMTRAAWSSMMQKGHSVSAGASASAYGFTAGTNYTNEKQQKQAEEFISQTTNQRMFSIGQKPSKSGKVSDWIQDTKESPSPMRLELAPISNILENPFYKKDKPVSNAVKENLKKALKDYCAKWLINIVRRKYPQFSCSEPNDEGLPDYRKTGPFPDPYKKYYIENFNISSSKISLKVGFGSFQPYCTTKLPSSSPVSSLTPDKRWQMWKFVPVKVNWHGYTITAYKIQNARFDFWQICYTTDYGKNYWSLCPDDRDSGKSLWRVIRRNPGNKVSLLNYYNGRTLAQFDKDLCGATENFGAMEWVLKEA